VIPVLTELELRMLQSEVDSCAEPHPACVLAARLLAVIQQQHNSILELSAERDDLDDPDRAEPHCHVWLPLSNAVMAGPSLHDGHVELSLSNRPRLVGTR
jgi:hypothetical protein